MHTHENYKHARSYAVLARVASEKKILNAHLIPTLHMYMVYITYTNSISSLPSLGV